MTKHEKTSARVGRTAAKTLTTKSKSAKTKAVAGSALSQTRTEKTTSAKTAKRASAVLRDGKSGPAARSIAGSVLKQRPAVKKKAPAEAAKKSAKKSASAAGSALTQHVATRRTPDGKPVRVVLTPYRGSSLRRDRVESVVSSVLARHKKK